MNEQSQLSTEDRAVESTLRAWYDAMRDKDFDAVASALTETFLIVENTDIMDKAALLARLRQGASMGRQTAELSDFNTRTHEDVAWTTLRNHEVWTPVEGVAVTFNFVETVVLVKSNEKWLIERYHATLIRPAK